MRKLKESVRENKLTILTLTIVLTIIGVIALNRTKELNDYGTVVEGTIIECEMIRLNGSCVVKIEYTTVDGVKKVSKNTLYNKSNCEVGKRIKIEYSAVSNLTNVIE